MDKQNTEGHFAVHVMTYSQQNSITISATHTVIELEYVQLYIIIHSLATIALAYVLYTVAFISMNMFSSDFFFICALSVVYIIRKYSESNIQDTVS